MAQQVGLARRAELEHHHNHYEPHGLLSDTSSSSDSAGERISSRRRRYFRAFTGGKANDDVALVERQLAQHRRKFRELDINGKTDVWGRPYGEIQEMATKLSPPDQVFMYNQAFLHAKRPEFWLIIVIVIAMLITGILAFVDDFKWNQDTEVFLSRSQWITLTASFLSVGIVFMGFFYYIRYQRSEVMGSLAWDHWALYNMSIWTIIGYFTLLLIVSLAPPSIDCEPPDPVTGDQRCRPWNIVVGLAIGLVLFAVNIMAYVIFQEIYLRYIHKRGHALLGKNPYLARVAAIIEEQQRDPDLILQSAIKRQDAKDISKKDARGQTVFNDVFGTPEVRNRQKDKEAQLRRRTRNGGRRRQQRTRRVRAYDIEVASDGPRMLEYY